MTGTAVRGIERQNSISERPVINLLKASRRWCLLTFRMLTDQNSPLLENPPDRIQGLVFTSIIRRVSKDKVELLLLGIEPRHGAFPIEAEHRCSLRQMGAGQVLADHARQFGAVLDEYRRGGASAQGLYSHCSSASVKVEERGAAYPIAQDGEKRLPYHLGSWPQMPCPAALQPRSPGFSCDDAHPASRAPHSSRPAAPAETALEW